MQSNKNTLQEYYQKNYPQCILPGYEYEATTKGWLCILTLPHIHMIDRHMIDRRVFRAHGQSKKQAAQSAAGQVLDILSGRSTDKQKSLAHPDNESAHPDNWALQSAPPVRWRFPGCVLVLIDLENSPRHDKKRWNSVRWDCSRIEAFVGKLSSHATKDLKVLYPFITHFHIVDSAHRDAVDHAISVRAGEWVESMKHGKYYIEDKEGCLYDDRIYIVSRDRFAPALVDVLRQKVSNSDIGFIHCINIDKCLEDMDKYATK